jgi:hypothetical protein
VTSGIVRESKAERYHILCDLALLYSPAYYLLRYLIPKMNIVGHTIFAMAKMAVIL